MSQTSKAIVDSVGMRSLHTDPRQFGYLGLRTHLWMHTYRMQVAQRGCKCQTDRGTLAFSTPCTV